MPVLELLVLGLLALGLLVLGLLVLGLLGLAPWLALLLAPRLADLWKEQLLVETKPGASGHIGADFVAQSPADGHTLLMSSTGALTEKNVSQFTPITLVSASPYVVTAHLKVKAEA